MNKKKSIGILLAALVVIGIIGSMGSDHDEGEQKSEPDKVIEKQTKNMGPFDVEFGDGNYVAGIDFPAGTYTITAVSGNGNVSSSNMYSGGLNEIMGVNGENTPEYKNAKLKDKVTLRISNGVTVKIHSDEVDLNAVNPRTAMEDKAITLSSGQFVAGTDFDAGTYTIRVVEGSGNVSSSNMFDGGLNAVMGVGDPTFYQSSYNNVELPKGTELKISGVTIQLIPIQ